MNFLSYKILLIATLCSVTICMDIVVNTWPFTKATDAAWCELKKSNDPMLAIERGCTEAEYDLSIPTVGYGGSPDENGNVTLDALIMNGDSMEAGSVAGMPHVKNAIKVAHYVLRYSRHTLLVGESAALFAKEMGFTWETLENSNSTKLYEDWKNKNCQPNFRRNVVPDATRSCGPYKPLSYKDIHDQLSYAGNRVTGTVDEYHHDTIGMIAMNASGSMAAGTSTNGASHRVAGRVGDSPIVGSGAYVDSSVGGAAGTGDGDIMMRFLLSYQTVEYMRMGYSPTKAATHSLMRVKQKGHWSGAIVALNKNGEFGGACVGFTDYYISVRSEETGHATTTYKINCFKPTIC